MRSRDYERLVHDLISELMLHSKAVSGIKILSGLKNKVSGASGFKHQIDVSIETNRALLLVECKYWTKAVDAEPVLVIASRLKDVRAANPGLQVEAGIVSTKRPTSGAQVLAHHFGIDFSVVSTPKEYAVLIGERFFVGRTESVPVSIIEIATVDKRDLS